MSTRIETLAATATFLNPVLVTDPEVASGVCARAAALYRGGGRVGFDTETDMSDRLGGKPVVASIATLSADRTQGECFVLDLRATGVEVLRPLAPARLIAHNAAFDAAVLSRVGVEFPYWADPAILDGLLRQGRTGRTFHPSLAALAERELGWVLDKELRCSFDRPGPLTRPQVVYAAQDALAALFCWLALLERTDEELMPVLEAEHGALPVLAEMRWVGIPFAHYDWSDFVASAESRRDAALARLASLTEPDESGCRPAWNPRSGQQLVDVLNRFEPEVVRAANAGELLEPNAKTDKQAMGRLAACGSEIASAILEFRAEEKLVSTYGGSLLEHVADDGRIHPSYTQCVTATGRLTSSSPNAQNLDPRVKPYVRAPEGRVFVSADLSQAELRCLADLSGDENLAEAFRSGEDVHIITAAAMFGIDRDELAKRVDVGDPEASALRKKGKALNFGTVYGQGPRALADTLTDAGVPTTREEARRLLDAYAAAYPAVESWLEERDATCERFAAETWDQVDWRTSLTDYHTDTSAVMLCESGEPVLLVSETKAGRRRYFDVTVTDWLAAQAAIALSSRKQAPTVDAWLAAHGVRRPNTGWLSPADTRKLLGSDKVAELATHLWDTLPDAADWLRREGFRKAALGHRNAYRNHPVQGGVADVMLIGLGRLWRMFRAEIPSARIVASIHDSVVVECDLADASLVGQMLDSTLTAAFAELYTSVPMVVDVSTAATLD